MVFIFRSALPPRHTHTREFRVPDASFLPVSRPHPAEGCSGDGPGALACVRPPSDLPFALEPGGAGAGAAGWGAVAACGARLRDAGQSLPVRPHS